MEEFQIRRPVVRGGNGNFPETLSLTDLAPHREAQLLGARIQRHHSPASRQTLNYR